MDTISGVERAIAYVRSGPRLADQVDFSSGEVERLLPAKGEAIKKDLAILGERVPLLNLTNVYLSVPGGKEQIYNDNLRQLVEWIGSRQNGPKESSLKKGMRFIKKKVVHGSTIRQIKLALRNIRQSVIHYRYDEEYVFRCSRDHYVEIIDTIIAETISVRKNETGDAVPSVPVPLSTSNLVGCVRAGLDHVANPAGNPRPEGIGTLASGMNDGLQALDTKYKGRYKAGR